MSRSNAQDPRQRIVGRLEYRGGLHLVSDDPRFGGISSLRVLPGGRHLAAVTDEGYWISARLVYRDRTLQALEDVEMGPLLGPDGKAPEGKDARDAESLALLPDGGFVVGFEREHRLLRYPAGTGRPDGIPVPFPAPAGIENAPFNGGIEALVALRGGGLLALTEYWIEKDLIVGWTGGRTAGSGSGCGSTWPCAPPTAPCSPRATCWSSSAPTTRSVASSTCGSARSGRTASGPALRLGGRLVAEFAPPLILDNFEGISAVSDASGETHVFLVTDDNLNQPSRGRCC